MSKRSNRRLHRKPRARIPRMVGLTAALIGAIGAATVSLTGQARAEASCAPRADVIEALTKGYTERSVGMGLASDGNMVELFQSKDGASWTIVVTLPNGMSCPAFAGQGWEKLPLKVAGRVS